MVVKNKTKKSVTFSSSTNESGTTNLSTDISSKISKFHSWSAVPWHLPILLAYIYPKLLEDPIQGLKNGLITLYPCQIAYGMLISIIQTNSQFKKKQSDENMPLLLVSGAFVSILLSIPTFLIIILLGAPLYGLLWETFLLSVHLSAIFFYPVLVYHRLDFSAITSSVAPGHDLILQVLTANQILFGSVIGILGTWLGVFPIPLDWDRNWQQWPITLLIGGYLGCFIGNLCSVICNLLH